MARELRRCPHCGATRKPTKQEERVAAVIMAVFVGMLGIVAWVVYLVATTPNADDYAPTARYEDPRDKRWDHEAGRTVIHAMAQEAGVSDTEMRRRVNDELDQRGLADWADGNE